MATHPFVHPIGQRLYVTLTDRCTLRCLYCPHTDGTWRRCENPPAVTQPPSAQAVIDAIGDPTRREAIVFGGCGEPTLRLEALLEIARHIKDLGGRARLDTDGLANRVHRRNVLPELSACVDALSIALNAQNAAVYERHCHPDFPGAYQEMLNFLQLAPRYLADVTATAIDGLADVDIEACARLAASAGARFQRRVLAR